MNPSLDGQTPTGTPFSRINAIQVDIALTPRTLAQALSGIVALLLLSHLTLKGLKYIGGIDLPTLLARFDVDLENNVPTWYASSTLLLASLFLFMIATVKRRQGDAYRWHWLALCVIFLGLSIDEAASIHELAIMPIRHAIPMYTSGYFFNAWIIPGSILVAIVGLGLSRFLLSLPSPTRTLFVVAGALFIAGAIGVEMIDGKYASVHGEDTFGYALFTAAEEGLEMFGIVVFLYALSSYLAIHHPTPVIGSTNRSVTNRADT